MSICFCDKFKFLLLGNQSNSSSTVKTILTASMNSDTHRQTRNKKVERELGNLYEDRSICYDKTNYFTKKTLRIWIDFIFSIIVALEEVQSNVTTVLIVCFVVVTIYGMFHTPKKVLS